MPEHEEGGLFILVTLCEHLNTFIFIMKTYKHLWEQFITEENFELAYKNSIKGKKHQRQVREFMQNEKEKLAKVRQLCLDGNFHTSKYKEKIIYEPKQRTIYKLPYCPDRIVQHAIMNVLKPIITNLLIENTYACIEGRGQLKASLKCSEYVRKYQYCLKCDIRKFYPSINQNILSGKLHRIIKDDKFMALLDDIIFSFEGGYNCPIGNYCSQWFGNYYLSFLDNYVLHTLKCGAYERYCDDFMLFSNDKAYLQDCKKKIEIFLRNELELEFSKAEVFDVKQGVDFCGYRHFGKYVLVRKSTAKRMKRRMKKISLQLADGNYKESRVKGQLASANGILKHACSYNFRQSLDMEELAERLDIVST